MPMATSRVTPLNSGSTQNEPPNCWMPEMPTASTTTPTMVPQTLTRPGLIVVDPRKAPTRAGSRYSRPTLAWPMRSLDASRMPVSAVSVPEATKAPMVKRWTGMPFSDAALALAPMA